MSLSMEASRACIKGPVKGDGGLSMKTLNKCAVRLVKGDGELDGGRARRNAWTRVKGSHIVPLCAAERLQNIDDRTCVTKGK